MNNEMKNLLKLFQCDINRSMEEIFSQVLTEKDFVRLFFINENQPFTDGRMVVVDPALREAFTDKKALLETENFMGLPHKISQNPWYALHMITRGQTIHESLHIIYTNFPPDAKNDARSTTKARLKTLAMIANIIEDAFIEDAGCSEFDNMELFLRFERISTFMGGVQTEGTVDRAFHKELEQAENSENSEEASKTAAFSAVLPLTEYLNYMCLFLLYPMLKLAEPAEEIAEYVEATKQLYLDGSACGNADMRFQYSQKIFDIIESLIPESEEQIDDAMLCKLLYSTKSHDGTADTIGDYASKGRDAKISRRLFQDLGGNALPNPDFSKQLYGLLADFDENQQGILQTMAFVPTIISWKGTQFDCSSLHKNIELIEEKPKPDLKYKKAYQNVCEKYRVNINNWNSRFACLLQTDIQAREEHRLFGSGISSRYLADTKRRYWYKNSVDTGVPEFYVMFMIDGSGSMAGSRRNQAVISSIILHEVLQKQNVPHAIVEHRGIYNELRVEHRILVDFSGRDEEKYNLMELDAFSGTREGLSLYWAEKYMIKYAASSDRIIIVLSDGVPSHVIDGNGTYEPPISLRDTAEAAKKIIRRGTNIIAVALDDGSCSCYDSLCNIYPSVIQCTDLTRLTGQLLGIISKCLQQ